MVLSSLTIDCVSRAIVWCIDEEDEQNDDSMMSKGILCYSFSRDTYYIYIIIIMFLFYPVTESHHLTTPTLIKGLRFISMNAAFSSGAT